MKKYYTFLCRYKVPIQFISVVFVCIQFVSQTVKSEPIYTGIEPNYWWYKFSTYSMASLFSSVNSRVVQANFSADFGWGQYAQRLTYRGQKPTITSIRSQNSGVKVMSYMEGLGQPTMYVAGFKTTNGVFPLYADELDLVSTINSAWNWNATTLANVNYRSWLGAHNSINDDEFVKPACTQSALGLPMPIYPDGSSAVGYNTRRQFPLNAKFYDMAMTKDINDSIPRDYENLIDISSNPALLKPILYKEKVGSYNCRKYPGKVNGDSIFPALIRVNKDPACPYWLDYSRAVAYRMMLLGDINGVWTDNYSPWDNFAGEPNKLFGVWSEYKFNQYLKIKYSAIDLANMGISNISTFNIRTYMKQKAANLGATIAQQNDPYASVYLNTGWYTDKVWNAYKVFKQKIGSEFLQNHYKIFKEEAAKAGKPDFAIGGNDVPMLNCGWVRDDYLDIVCTEISMGNRQTVNYNGGIGLPPLGKYAPIYLAALEHQKGPYSMVWLYGVNDANCSNGVSKVVLSEAFANSTFVKYASNTAASPTAQKWLNSFAEREEANFGRRYLNYDIGILFSADNYFAQALPGSLIPDENYQTHRQDYLGFATAMIDAHLPFRVITDWKLDAARLSTLKTFIMPCADYLNDSTLSILTNWVENGGRLVLTGSPGKFYDTDGLFQRRSQPLLQNLVGRNIGNAPEIVRNDALVYDKTVYTRTVGNGTVVWTAEPVGMNYFNAKYSADAVPRRAALLLNLKTMMGTSGLFDGSALPVTVGSYLWKSADERTLFVDLVNYDLDQVQDTITKALNLSFKLNIGSDKIVNSVIGIAPDDNSSLNYSLDYGWLTVTVPTLQNYLSVRVITSHFTSIDPNLELGDDISVVPNPAGDYINISSSARQIRRVEIFDNSGRMCLQKQVAENGILNIEELQSGIYNIRILFDDNTLVNKKMIKK